MHLTKIALPVLLALSVQSSLANTQQNQLETDFSNATLTSVEFGLHAVGTKIIFARDNSQHFDSWNTAYASDKYRELLEEVEKSGQTRTVATSIWYPVKASSERVELNDRLRSPQKAISGKQAKVSDYLMNDPKLYPLLARFYSIHKDAISTKTGTTLIDMMKEGNSKAYAQFTSEIMNQKRGAFLDAPIAEGSFPVVILSHGLGGNYAMWDRAGEFLASQGYIVAAPTFISDGTTPIVFHDPASEFANTHTQEEIEKAYQILSEEKVVPNFMKFLFGAENITSKNMKSFDPTKYSVLPGGPEKMVAMQRNLFRQRVNDVNVVKKTLEVLNQSEKDCKVLAQGSVKKHCGLFAGHINTNKVGLAGHSLGSMTSQLGLEHIPGVTTAIGMNNGVPFSWTPQEMFGSGTTENGLPVGNQKPLLQLIGNEDDFIQSIFYSLSQKMVELAGGDSSSILQLDTERADITKTNPQPVALSSYKRATNDKMLVTISDVDHGILTQHGAAFHLPKYMQENGSLTFKSTPNHHRKATGSDLQKRGFVGEEFELLDWDQNASGQWYYKPHVIRDYYSLNWFNYYLKGDKSARKAIIDAPFKTLTSVRTNLK